MPKKPCKPCSSTQVCNPESGRCVKKTGKIGRRMLGVVSHPKGFQDLTVKEKKEICKSKGLTLNTTATSSKNYHCRPKGSTKHPNPFLQKTRGKIQKKPRKMTQKKPQKKRKIVALTYNQIMKQLPKRVPKSIENDSNVPAHLDPFGVHESMEHLPMQAQKRFGPHLVMLTKEIAQSLVGQVVYIVWGQGWWGTLKRGVPLKDVKEHIESVKIYRVSDTGIVFVRKDSMWDPVWPMEEEVKRDDPFYGKDHHEYVYFSSDVGVTGSGADPVYIFVK